MHPRPSWIVILVSTLLVFAGCTAIAGRQYVSTATLQFDRPLVENASAPGTRIDGDNADFNVSLTLLRSAAIRQRVIASLSPAEVEILQRPFLAQRPAGAPAPTIVAALGSVDIDSVRPNLVLIVRVRHPGAAAAALVANRYAKAFLDHLQDQENAKYRSAIDFLRQRAAQLRVESADADAKLQAYRQAHGATTSASGAAPPGELRQLEYEAESAKSNYASVSDRLNQALVMVPSPMPVPAHLLAAAVPASQPEN